MEDRKIEKFLYILIFIFTTLYLTSCESNEEPFVIRAQDYYGDGSYFISLSKLKAKNLNVDFCGEPQIFELRTTTQLDEFGTVTLYYDKQNLNFQSNLLEKRINEGYGIGNTYVWIGPKEDWIYGRKGPVGGWRAISEIDHVSYPSRPTEGLHQIPLKDWMFENCFVIAIRVSLEDKNGNWTSPKAFINHGDYITFTWNEIICLEKCDDPGTHSAVYWVNNSNEWQQGVTIGGIFYTQEIVIHIMTENFSNDDMSYILSEQLVGAKLNVAIGNTSYCIYETILDADEWMEEFGPVGSGVSISNSAWDSGSILTNNLERYNNGLLCADPAN